MSVAGQKRRREDDAIDEVGDGGVGRDEVANGLNPVKLMAEPAELMAEPAKVMAGVKVSLPNPHLAEMESDYLYHLGYGRDEARQIFHDVKFVVMGGSAERMGSFAEVIAVAMSHPKRTKKELSVTKTDRFSFYKIGPVLSISHGMGVPSVSIMLHELFKLLHYAGASNTTLFRIGTSGGIGVPAGTLVITNRSFSALLKEEHETVILGKRVARPVVMDQELAQSLLSAQTDHSFSTVLGATMCTDDFYEGQGRLDGAVCDHTHEDKMAFLRRAHQLGVVNIEMECTAIAALCHKAGFSCAVACVTLVDRLKGDQVSLSREDYKEYGMRPQQLVAHYITSQLNCRD